MSNTKSNVSPQSPQYKFQLVKPGVTVKWSIALCEKSKRILTYIKIGSTSGSLSLTGAERHWKKQLEQDGVIREELDVYIPELRVVGSLRVLQDYFNKCDINVSDYDHYTYDNTREGESMRTQYEREIDERKKSKKEKKTTSNYTLDDLKLIVKHIDQLNIVKKGAPKSTRELLTEEEKKNHLESRLSDTKNRGSDKVLSVSTYNFVTGTGAKIVAPPKGTSIRSAHGAYVDPNQLAKYPIISNNRENFVTTVELLYPNKATNLIICYDKIKDQRMLKSTEPKNTESRTYQTGRSTTRKQEPEPIEEEEEYEPPKRSTVQSKAPRNATTTVKRKTVK